MSASSLAADLRMHLNALFGWVEHNGFAGWDPYDIWDTRVGSWAVAKPRFGRRVARLVLSRADEVWPVRLRHVLGARPSVNAKGMGLFAAALLRLEALEGTARRVSGEVGYVPCFRWLDANRCDVGDGIGWGYPFNWQSRVYIPQGTPTVVNSCIIGDAYWHYYKLHDAGDALARCEAICRFILGGLNRSPGTSGTFCFSYTPLDHMEVHNANLFGAEFLVRIGTETGRAEWVETGLAAAYFSLGQIRDDGTLSYWSDEQSTSVPQQDTYHAGFEIRALHGIAQATGLDVFRAAAALYFDTWRREYFEPDGTPCFQRGSRGVVEVHSLAESLLCAARMHADGVLDDEGFLAIAGPAFVAGTRALWVPTSNDTGYFARIRRRRYGMTVRMEIPFIRWGEAWMAAAMAAALERVSAIAKNTAAELA